MRTPAIHPLTHHHHHTGHKVITISPSPAAHAVELGFEGVADDVKLNLGATLLRNAMRHWATRYAALHMSGAPLPGLDDAEPAGPQFSEEAPPSGDQLPLVPLYV